MSDITCLAKCYEAVKSIAGDSIDSFAAVKAVDAHRMFWKPSDVKVILLAESHVFTEDSELSHKSKNLPVELEGYPEEFVRFVYCLGYGENGILREPVSKNSGTPQFWKIFFSCCNQIHSNDDFAPILKSGTPNLDRRIANKIALLQRLKDMGVWLVDASIGGLYLPGGVKPPQKLIRDAIRVSWESCVKQMVIEANPQHIICIGKTVEGVLGGDLRSMVGGDLTVVKAPAARMTAKELLKNYREFFELLKRLLSRAIDSNLGRLGSLPKKEVGHPKANSAKSAKPMKWTLNKKHGYYVRTRLQELEIEVDIYFKPVDCDKEFVGVYVFPILEMADEGLCKKGSHNGEASYTVKICLLPDRSFIVGNRTGVNAPLDRFAK